MFKTGEHFVCDFDEGFKINGSPSWIIIGRKNEVFSLRSQRFFRKQVQTNSKLCIDAVALCRLSFYIISRHYQLQNNENFFIPASFPQDSHLFWLPVDCLPTVTLWLITRHVCSHFVTYQVRTSCYIYTSLCLANLIQRKRNLIARFLHRNLRRWIYARLPLCVNKMPINLRYENRYCSLALVSWIEMRSSVFNKAFAIDVNRRYIITANYLATYKRKYLYYAILAIGIWLPIYNHHNHPLINDRIASFGPSKVESDINWRPVDNSRPIDFFFFFSLSFFFL